MNVTPNGLLTGFVAIEKPSTKFDDNGVYSCQVAFIGEAAKKMKKAIDELMAESANKNKSVKKAAAPPYTIEGKTLVVKFKQKAKIMSRTGQVWEKEVKLFDASNKPITDNIMLGQGSIVRVAFNPYLWGVAALGCGCTLQLEMVQVIELVRRDGSDTNPFEATDGFTAADKEANPFEAGEEEDFHQAMVDKEEDDDIDF